ncbi:hypothetical protein CWC05_23820, partial [Pseudoalteromonas ruthenica]
KFIYRALLRMSRENGIICLLLHHTLHEQLPCLSRCLVTTFALKIKYISEVIATGSFAVNTQQSMNKMEGCIATKS